MGGKEGDLEMLGRNQAVANWLDTEVWELLDTEIDMLGLEEWEKLIEKICIEIVEK